MEKRPPGGIKSRITGEAEVEATSLKDHPLNWRQHPANQRAALEGALDEIGWIQRVIVNQRTGHILDGHLRVQAARNASETVPVIYVDLSEEEEHIVLASVDPVALMAGIDLDKHRELIDQVETDNEALAELLRNAVGDQEEETIEKPGDDNYKEQYGLIVECADHADQQRVVKRLQAAGYTAKAITV